jgi:tRNA dimethylallyltransferase
MLVGATASGKGGVAHEAARRLGGEILAMDSMKVYRGMDIGTAKPPAQRMQELPYHMVDVVDPWEPYSAARFLEEADRVIAQVHAGGRPLVVSGGTPLYMKALMEGLFKGPGAQPLLRERLARRAREEGTAALHGELSRIDPASARRIRPTDERRILRALEVYETTGLPISEFQKQEGGRRPGYRFGVVGIRRGREDLHRRIAERAERMVGSGWEAEMRRLFDHPRGIGPQAEQSVGVREWRKVFSREWSQEEALAQIVRRTRRFAKQQLTWFRRFPEIHWIDAAPDEEGGRLVEETLAIWERLCA